MPNLPTRRAMLAAALAATTGLAACATSPDGPVAPDAPGSAQDFVLSGRGGPTIVLIHGLADDRTTWRRVFDPLAEKAATFSFNRPGYGRASATERPRDAVHISDDIRKMLATLAGPPPYLLVGHSLGGIYAQAFASRFPADTAGLVLVDTTLPGQTRFLRANAAAQLAAVNAIMRLEAPTVRREFEAAGIAEDQVEQMTPYRGGPVLLLEAMEPDPIAPPSFSGWRQARMRALAEASGGEVRRVPCGHFIQREQPAAVIAAVETALARARR